MPPTQVRIVGSGYTTLEYAGKAIAWLDSFADTGQAPYGEGFQAIYTLSQRRAVEIAVGRVLGAGALTASIRELWNAPVWYQLSGLSGRRTITDVWEALRQNPNAVTCRMVIRPPNNRPVRGKIYHGCVVTAIDDAETVNLGALSVARNVTIGYTHTTSI